LICAAAPCSATVKTAAKFGRLESGFSPRFFISIRRKFFWQGGKRNGVSHEVCAMQGNAQIECNEKIFSSGACDKKFSDFGGVRKFLDFAGGKN